MDEDFRDVTQDSKKVGIFLVLFIILIAVLGYFLVFKRIHFSVKTVKLELGESLSDEVNDYLVKEVANTEDYTLDLSKVKANEIGEYTYTITYNKVTRKGKVKVVDTTAPTFVLQEMTIEEGTEDVFLGDFLSTCEDNSKPCLVTLKNSKDESKFNEIGTHTIDIEVADLYGNKSSAKATLKVVAKGTYVDERTLDLEYSSNSKNIENFDGTIYKKLEKAIPPGGEEAGDAISDVSTVDLEEYVRTNYDGYRLVSSEIIELYNKSSYIIGYSIELKISNGKERTVYVDKTKVKETQDTPSDTDEQKEED